VDATDESQREQVLLRLAKQDYQNLIEAFHAVTEATVAALDVERVSIWRILHNSEGIACEDLYIRSARAHEHGLVLWARDYPRYFEALLESRTIPADDARVDPRTWEFADNYLEPRGITSMLDVPIWHKGALYGILCHEHLGPRRRWRVDEAELAGNLADLVALALERNDRRAAERRWTSVVDELMEAVFVLDPDLTIVQMNAPARELLERLGGPLRREDRVRSIEYRDLKGRLVSEDQTPLGRAMRGQCSSDLLVIESRQAGRLGSFRVTVSPIIENGQIKNYVAMLHDVTQQVENEQLKAEFLSTLAHELKTPATVVRGFTELLESDPRVPLGFQEQLDTIVHASARTERLIDDAVEMAGLTVGRLSLTHDVIEMRALVGSVVASVAAASPGHPIRLNAPKEAKITVDPPRIEQVIRRLLDNAVHRSLPGGEVEVEVVTAPTRVTVLVHDHGYGIPPDRQASIFDAFCRGEKEDSDGLGIGLHLARETVRLHGGDMSLHSLEGKGSTFSFWLPREAQR